MDSTVSSVDNCRLPETVPINAFPVDGSMAREPSAFSPCRCPLRMRKSYWPGLAIAAGSLGTNDRRLVMVSLWTEPGISVSTPLTVRTRKTDLLLPATFRPPMLTGMFRLKPAVVPRCSASVVSRTAWRTLNSYSPMLRPSSMYSASERAPSNPGCEPEASVLVSSFSF